MYTLPKTFIKKHHNKNSSWQKVRLKSLENEIQQYKNEKGIEIIAKKLGVEKPIKKRDFDKTKREKKSNFKKALKKVADVEPDARDK